MMNIHTEYNYYVIKFTNLPHPSVPPVVFVPNSWVRTKPADASISIPVSYPIEQHVATEGRILSGEVYKQDWPIFVCDFIAGYDTIDEAKRCIENLRRSPQHQVTGDEEDFDEDDAYECVYGLEPQRKRVSFSGLRARTPTPSQPVSSNPVYSRASHPPKRRLSASQPSTSAQAMTELQNSRLDLLLNTTSRELDPINKKMRLSRDIKFINRTFENIHDQFDDLNNVMSRIRASLIDVQSAFSTVVRTLNGVAEELSDDTQPIESNDFNLPNRSYVPGILKPVAPTKVEIPQLSSKQVTNPQDSKWTLRYREKLPGVTELLPGSGVYLAEYGLKRATKDATDAKTLARMLLKEIFSDYALSVCSLAGGKNGMSDRVRPGLDKKARAFLMEFVEQYSRQRNWEVNEHSILMSLRNKLLEMRRNTKSTSSRPFNF